MWRFIALAILLASSAACAETATAPEPVRTATATPPVRTFESNCDEVFEAVRPVLSYGDQSQDDSSISINWHGDECIVTGHPIASLPIPKVALVVPLGEGPVLEFLTSPESLSGYAWRPTYEEATESSDGRLDVPLDDARRTTRVDLEFASSASQVLDLSPLPPGKYAIEAFAGWPEGSTGYAFHVEIVEN